MNLDGLNTMQKKAVMQTEGPLLVLAGAGSGKTRVLTHRVQYLIEEKGVAPQNILAITFTNKAAKEMKERVEGLIGDRSKYLWVSTFHSMCVRILRKNINSLGYDNSFVIYDSQDQGRIVKQSLKELNIDDKQFSYKKVQGKISSIKNDALSPARYKKKAFGDFYEEKIAEIYALYENKLRSNNALDFDDLLVKTLDLFNEFPDILGIYQEKFKYIMVDEYQDTNSIQYKLVHLLSEKYKNLCVVGDDDQSIYGWRGANIYNILDFEKDFDNTVVIKLEKNYRSTSNILDAANDVIKNNLNRKEKMLYTDNETGEKINIYKSMDEHDEAKFIVNTVRREVNTNSKEYKDFAILYRTNAQSRVIEEHFSKAFIPYRLLGGTRFYQRKEIKDIIAYLNVICNSSDDLSIKRIINVPKRGIGNTTISRIDNVAINDGIDFYEVLKNADNYTVLKRGSAKLKSFYEFIAVLKVKKDVMRPSDILNEVINTTGYIKELENEGTDEAKDRIENIKELITKVIEYQTNSEDKSLDGFLQEVSLVADIDNYEEEANAVVLMTLHSAKGLEFNNVFIAGAEDGLFPSFMSINGEDDKLEEERRLCYVGITRARKRLWFTYASTRRIQGDFRMNKSSRFIDELPEHLLEYNTNKPRPKIRDIVNSKVEDNIYKKPSIPKPKDFNLDIQEGDVVKHKKFGIGTINKIRPAGADYELDIIFDNFGIKKLMAKFSGVKKVK